MQRREFIAGLGATGVWPLAGQAQQAKMPVIGLLNGATSAAYAGWTAAIRRGLRGTLTRVRFAPHRIYAGRSHRASRCWPLRLFSFFNRSKSTLRPIGVREPVRHRATIEAPAKGPDNLAGASHQADAAMTASRQMSPDHWRELAGRARSRASSVIDPESKMILLQIADAYERLAKRRKTTRRAQGAAPSHISDVDQSILDFVQPDEPERTIRLALERCPFRLTISRICEVCSAFGPGDLIETPGDGLAEACDGECAVLESVCGDFAQQGLELGE